MTRDEQARELCHVFGGSVAFSTGRDSFTVERPKAFALPHLVRACEILECRPEELFFNADTDGGGGCSSCAGSEYPTLEIEVRR